MLCIGGCVINISSITVKLIDDTLKPVGGPLISPTRQMAFIFVNPRAKLSFYPVIDRIEQMGALLRIITRASLGDADNTCSKVKHGARSHIQA